MNKFRTRETVQLSASLYAQLFQPAFGFLADSPDFAHGQVFHELWHFFRRHLDLTVGLVHRACDFRHEFVWTDSCRGCQLCFAKNHVANDLRKRARRTGMSRDIEISFIEREWLNQRSEPVQNRADHSRFAPINIESRG